MEENVVNVPLVGGINEEDDLFSVEPPEMLQLINVQAVKKGALDTRQGFNLVTKSATVIEPATAFRDSSGATQLVSPDIEALGTYASTTGTRPVLAAGGKFYEYVGSDATHGFREVNDLPEYVGTLTSVSSTGGSIIEIESLLFDNETKRITVWVTGVRTGHELASDRPMVDQIAGDGNSVYYSIQSAATEAYVVPPTRLNNASGTPTTAAINLRLVAFHGSTTSRLEPMAFWYNYSTGQIECCLFELDNGAPKATTTLPKTVTPVLSHRNFDVVAFYQPTVGPYYTFLYAICEQDTASSVTPAKVEVRIGTVNGTTGVVTSVLTNADILSGARSGVGIGFVPWANRGVVLEQSAEMTAAGFTDWTATVSVGIRVVARYRTSEVLTTELDGQLCLGRLFTSRTAGVYALAVYGYKYIPLIGFQTNDDLSQVTAASAAPRYFSGSPQTITPLESNVTTATALPSLNAFGLSGRNSEWTLKLRLDDNSEQVYFCSLSTKTNYSTPAWTQYWTLSPRSSQPFDAELAAGFSGTPSGCYEWIRENYAPTPHAYIGAQNLAFDTPTPTVQPGRQVNFIDISAAGGSNTGFTDGYYPSVNILDATGGNVIATAMVVISGGSIEAISIIDPLGGPAPGGYPFVGPSLVGIQLDPASGVGTVAMIGATAYNLTRNLTAEPTGSDRPERASVQDAPNASFWFSGQQEHCVHRWSVAHTGGTDLVVLASCAATPVTNPHGDAPFQAASPMRLNNFCEFWRYTSAVVNEYDPLVPLNGGSTANSNLSCAAGGPWRLVGGLVVDGGRFYAGICPAGDDAQASTFLVRLTPSDDVALVWPDGDSLEPVPTASSVTYGNNKGLFVEAANLMRVTSPPLNVPALRVTRAGLSMGALRNGTSKGTQECFALDYEYVATNWRSLLRMSDYTFVNGGVLSVFDGANCNEAGMLVWPQRDLTSIWWGDGTNQHTKAILASDPTYLPFQQFDQPASVPIKPAFRALYNITRPYWFYEAGLNVNAPNVLIGLRDSYERVTTKWGGDPSASYESIYADGRVQQFSSFTKAGFSGGADFYGPHYYGRFQNAGTDFHNDASAKPLSPLGNKRYSYFLWAPRSARGWSYPNDGTVKGNGESAYSQAESGGDFLMSWCYEYADGTGRMVRSAPSNPAQYTVCAEVFSSDPDADRNSGKRRIGGIVSRFKWGFLAPRLELTNRLSAAAEDPRRVLLQPYSTCEPYSTVMYRMPWGNFENPINDFVVPRNATRGVVAYATQPYDTSTTNPCGYVATNVNRPPSTPGAKDGRNAIFDGTAGDYMGMLREPYLYTTGGVLDNVATPGCKAMCVHQNRLVVAGADDPTVVWFSKELSPTDAVGFNDLLTLTIEAGGAVTGLASMNSSLFVFKKNDVYVISGTMPDATGNSSSLSEPTRLPSGIGCIDHRSVLSTPIGIFFQSTRSIELLTPDLQIRPIGDKVIDRLTFYPYVTSVSHNATTQEVYFVCHSNRLSRSNPTATAIVLVYSYLINAWYEWQVSHLATGPAAMTVVGLMPWLAMHDNNATGQAYVYQQMPAQYVDGLEDTTPPTNAYTYTFIQSSWLTAPFALNQVQGFQRAKRCRLLARIVSGNDVPGFLFGIVTDLSATQTSTWTSAEVGTVIAAQGAVQLETHLANQKGQLVALSCSTLAPGTGVTSTGGNVRFSNVALVVGLKAGLNKRITEEAKH
jgi:hypothetical protein